MKQTPQPAIRVAVDPTNPGQFFACCGLLELADRLWDWAEGWFDGNRFTIRAEEGRTLPDLLRSFRQSRVIDAADEGDASAPEHSEEQAEDGRARPLELDLGGSSRSLRLDWWGDKSLKPWAGSMVARAIFIAMKHAIDVTSSDPFNDSRVVFDPDPDFDCTDPKAKRGKKREPFYFDSRRGASARSLDIGFAPDALKMTSSAFPGVEALCLVGLQRCRPVKTNTPRIFDYNTWARPLAAPVLPAAVCGLLPNVGSRRFRFENAFRTDQRKHKAYCPAVPMHGDHDD